MRETGIGRTWRSWPRRRRQGAVVAGMVVAYGLLALVERSAVPVAYLVIWSGLAVVRVLVGEVEVRGDELRVPTGLRRHRTVPFADVARIELPHPFATGTGPVLVLGTGERLAVPRWAPDDAARVARRRGLATSRGPAPARPRASPASATAVPPRMDVAREAAALHARDEQLQRELRRIRGGR